MYPQDLKIHKIMENNGITDIYADRQKMALFFICSVAIAFICYKIIGNNPLLKSVSLFVVFAFFTLSSLVWLFIILKSYIKNKPMVRMTPEHLEIFSPAKQVTLSVAWSEISDFEVVNIFSQKFIIVELIHPDGVIDRETNAQKRRVMKWNKKNFGSPYCICRSNIGTRTGKVMKLLRQYKEQA